MSYKIKSRIWIETNNNVLLGEGRVQLLKEIEKTGSLSKAAKELKMSYKKAWTMVDSINKSAKEEVITKVVGGQGGGGAKITTYGKKLMAIFDDINSNCWVFLDEQLKKLDNL
tara:strand:+ start:321 stop:659 length:339 start_codon:yes stop_codon:yes gene_type:complete